MPKNLKKKRNKKADTAPIKFPKQYTPMLLSKKDTKNTIRRQNRTTDDVIKN